MGNTQSNNNITKVPPQKLGGAPQNLGGPPQKLGSGGGPSQPSKPSPQKLAGPPPQKLGGSATVSAPPPADTRSAAAEAAQRRLQAAQTRGKNDANPNAGKLSEQLKKQNSVPAAANPNSRADDRLVWD